ncbi:hypothetical protein HOD96_00365 [Candidatus Falkowbacteria bacterium]|jgi:hypothetical protein|nr:hypothetical protein [Candidatus Falkowbacteria bacterium]MBT4433307.1 hypothetical protein [Candidatus Falkowbacteria bacterium]
MFKDFEQISPYDEKELEKKLARKNSDNILTRISPREEKKLENEIKIANSNTPEEALVNEEGEPLLLYRGSDLSFDQEERYSKEHLGSTTEAPSAGEAFFFTNRKKTADYYSRGANPNKESSIKGGGDPHIDRVKLIMKNPYIHDFKGKFYRGEETTYYNLIKKAKEEGYDGVIFKNTYDGGEYGRLDAVLKGRFKSEDIYGVFEPEQIVFVNRKETVSPRKKRRLKNKK